MEPTLKEKPTLNLPSVANGEFAPLCGAAATSVATLKTPVAQREGSLVRDFFEGEVASPSGGRYSIFLQKIRRKGET